MSAVARRRICVVSGGRADYGLLYWPMKEIQSAPGFELLIAVTGMHLSPEFGATAAMFGQDGFAVDARVEMLLSSATPAGVAKSIGLGVIGFADAFERLKPDLLMVLGDRFEILAAAQAALVARLPIAHLCGGDVTEGAFDEAIRHAITKMAHLHFATNEDSARRLRQLGEDPQRIFTVGSPGLDYIRRLAGMTREAIAQETGLDLKRRLLLVTYHPPTLGTTGALAELEELLSALDAFGPQTTLAFTLPNADTEGRLLAQRLKEFVADHVNARLFAALGSRLYLNLLREADAIVGNSSSGLYEAPSLGTPTVDIGERQQGRLRAASVISCRGERGAITAAIAAALKRAKQPVANPYGDGDSARRIVEILAGIGDFRALTQKRFFDLPEAV
jgi:UDP-N-acetylglucosamine 2-epimerase (non-hydrolysing)/GDP/UDP-N,N'-diacetylbacillosamine 2-epimerase (hydrolysing)